MIESVESLMRYLGGAMLQHTKEKNWELPAMIVVVSIELVVLVFRCIEDPENPEELKMSLECQYPDNADLNFHSPLQCFFVDKNGEQLQARFEKDGSVVH